MKHDELKALVSPVIESIGLECLGIEYAPSRGNSLVRVYVDAPGRPVTIEDCEAASREISAALDVADPIGGRYTLEVSSPGLDRPLFEAAHFARFVGEVAWVSLNVPMNGRRRFQGPIRGVDGTRITIEQDGAPVVLEHGNVLKAHLVHQFEATPKPGAPRPGKGKAKAAPDAKKKPKAPRS